MPVIKAKLTPLPSIFIFAETTLLESLASKGRSKDILLEILLQSRSSHSSPFLLNASWSQRKKHAARADAPAQLVETGLISKHYPYSVACQGHIIRASGLYNLPACWVSCSAVIAGKEGEKLFPCLRDSFKRHDGCRW